MDLDDLSQEQGSDEMNYPAMSPQDQLTYDPTQGRGTDAWEMSRKASMELNAELRRN